MNKDNADKDLSYKVAAIQFNPVQGDVASNQQRMAGLLSEAAENGARLIVFPEMASSGYVWNDREEIAPFVETIPGPTTAALLAVTHKYRCYAAFGLPEVDSVTGAYYNSAVLIGPDGVVGKYRKTHLFAADPRWACEGNEGIAVFATEIGNIALLICMDAMYFEPARIAALQQADVIAFPTNWVGAGNNEPSKTWCIRAKENGVYWVAANRSDTERGALFTGGSAVIVQDGSVQNARVSGEGIVYGTVRINAVARHGLIEGRRPKAYQELLLHPYLWKEGETHGINTASAYEVIVLALGATDSAATWIDRLSAAMDEAKSRLRVSNRLYVLPEFHVAAASDRGQDKELLSGIQRLAESNNGFVVLGLSKGTRGKTTSSVYLLGPDGVVGHNSQVHPDSPEQADPNARFCTFELPFGRVGLLTERDAEYPESYRVLAKQGADIIAVSESGKESLNTWMKRIWAFENDAIVACSLPSGVSGSLLFLHRQLAMEGAADQEALIGLIEPEMTAAARSRSFMRRLKTHLYDTLVMGG
ncbi:nitrilase [Paenibacillus polysaccharolyticus]|uniref:nitrilase-related carbon-nitrogen hydrolase n=1 Tax=Paenibacillus polysaccharolyticus TaxID=582692 RepID=UPI00209FC8E3|nr:nitrilase-related carbon-nitrogen hydrolase [Paenibacillus polysaccharolyticus]MCP1136232.1 nitrilase [Paenibacillus polysaccharolyticus]